MDDSTSPKTEQLLRLPEVERLTGLARSTIYSGVKARTFPSPVKLSARAIAWKESDVARWQASRVAVVA